MELPLTRDAVDQYRQQGGCLTDPTPFATDPLEGYNALKEERNTRYIQAHPDGHDYEYLFSTLINCQSTNFAAAITTFTSITSDLLP